MSNLTISCPACGEIFDLYAALDTVEGRQFVELLTKLPPTLIRPALGYLKLFRPKKKVLSWARATELLTELEAWIQIGKITRNRTIYMVPLSQWVSVLNELVKNKPGTLVLPLTSHAYLLQILANQCEQGMAKTEQQNEQQRQNRSAQPVATEAEISYAKLVEMAAEKEKERRAKTQKPPANAVVDPDTGELMEKPKSKPPSGWNPLRDLLPKVKQPATLPTREEIEAAERLLQEEKNNG